MKVRAAFVPFLMFFLALDFYVLSLLGKDDYYYFLVFIVIEGLLIGGPYMIISAAIACDLGKKE